MYNFSANNDVDSFSLSPDDSTLFVLFSDEVRVLNVSMPRTSEPEILSSIEVDSDASSFYLSPDGYTLIYPSTVHLNQMQKY